MFVQWRRGVVTEVGEYETTLSLGADLAEVFIPSWEAHQLEVGDEIEFSGTVVNLNGTKWVAEKTARIRRP